MHEKEKGGRVLAKYVDSVAHQIMAASDILVCAPGNESAADMPVSLRILIMFFFLVGMCLKGYPSFQLIAMQYGSVPIIKQQEGCEGRQAVDLSSTMFFFITSEDLLSYLVSA